MSGVVSPQNRVSDAAGYWFVRRGGWVQGPLTRESIRHMYASGWVLSLDMIANAATGPWKEARDCLELRDPADMAGASGSGAAAVPAEWEFVSATVPCTEPVTFAMLQLLAAAGRLRPGDPVRRRPDGDWGPAMAVGGVFGGPRAFCPACGRKLSDIDRVCPCGAPQPEYEPSLAEVGLVCGGVAVVLLPLIIGTVTWLAWRQAVVFDIAMSEGFPQVFAVLLAPIGFLAAIAIVFGQAAISSVNLGRAAPSDRRSATAAVWLGVACWISLLLTAVAVVAFSLAYFTGS